MKLAKMHTMAINNQANCPNKDIRKIIEWLIWLQSNYSNEHWMERKSLYLTFTFNYKLILYAYCCVALVKLVRITHPPKTTFLFAIESDGTIENSVSQFFLEKYLTAIFVRSSNFHSEIEKNQVRVPISLYKSNKFNRIFHAYLYNGFY